MGDIYWAAGFLEGDGNFIINNRNKKPGNLTVRATQKDPEVLYRLRDLFGGSVSAYTRKSDGRTYHHWHLAGARSRGLAMTVYSLLTERRQAQLRECFGCA